MKFITKRNSKTGKKFSAIDKRLAECLAAQKKLAKKIGFHEWRNQIFTVGGGLSAVIFKDRTKVDPAAWKNVNGSTNEWMPRLSTIKGRELEKEFKKLPMVQNAELNECIGMVGHPFKRIGFASNNKTYFGFVVGDDWGVKIPRDCKEVTVSTYNKMFKD